MKEKGITTYTIRQKALIPQGTLAKLKMCSGATMAEIEQKLQEYKASHICIIGKRGVIMETLAISPDFTIEDIHKIREQNYEKTKDMTVAEKVAYYNNSGKEAEEEINRRRALKQRTIASV